MTRSAGEKLIMMKRLALSAVAPLLVLGGAAMGADPPDESAVRRWLNEHVIAVANDGRAIEPYDYFSGPTIPLGVVHLHPGTDLTAPTTADAPSTVKTIAKKTPSRAASEKPIVHSADPEFRIKRTAARNLASAAPAAD